MRSKTCVGMVSSCQQSKDERMENTSYYGFFWFLSWVAFDF